MASQWYSLVSQKLFMARVLLRQADTPSSGEDASDALQREAGLQGSIELTLRARRLLLIMVAKLYQQKQSDPETLEALVTLLGEDNPETAELLTLARKGGSWWNHLDQLEAAQAKPPATRKTVSAENIIAISADSGPDRSAAALGKVLDALKQFADTLEERHSEW
ncbi:DUF6586 family protein [Marinobacter sp. M-5]|uniref:DUF6586 family protein n=1 Tax=Marinobacter sp. M-5 TaxID=3081089 RepID=UPI00293D0512|nr:DUF6586 family protein [Marinobacter sp. M-5]MDV3503186.1 DUF6586 family protein [Marinobacter sp. M-5]